VAPRRKKSGGDCYEAAGKYILDLSKLFMGNGGKIGGDVGAAQGLILVHAEVRGQGPMEGTNFGHAFVLDSETDMVIDKSNGRNLRIPKILYYQIANILEIDNFHEYTPKEMISHLIKFKHWGPWELVTSSGL
jgi:hypothetical protein